MVPNGSAYANFPSFANNGTKTPPGGSTESAKYALGMVPADTFPAEWANYLFHGATAGITRLNSDTGSIKKEINTVLACENITPDAESCSQLYCALTKIRDEAVALAYPVGTVYMNAKCATLPAALQAIGTWCAIDGRFLRACSSRIGCTGGAGSVTLAVCNLPSHSHSITDHSHKGTVGCHNHATPAHCHSGPSHVHYFSAYMPVKFGVCGSFSAGSGAFPANTTSGVSLGNADFSNTGSASVLFGGLQTYGSSVNKRLTIAGNTDSGGGGNTGNASPTTCCTQPGFTGGSICLPTGCTAINTGTAGSGCSFDIIPSYRDVAMWYRDA